ncbi:MAG: hypothetical protein U1E19_10895 [Rhodoblastus sp.]
MPAEIVAFPDDDCWYPDALCGRIVAMFDGAPDAGVLTGRTIDAAGADSLGLFLERDAEDHEIQRLADREFQLAFHPHRHCAQDRRLRRNARRRRPHRLQVRGGNRFPPAGACNRRARLYRRDLLVHHDQAPVGGASGVSRAQDYARGFGRVLRLHDYGAPYTAMRIARTSARALLALATGDMATARYKALWALGTLKGFIAPLPGRGA